MAKGLKIIFRVDSSFKMGAGHLMRCLTLAEELKRKNHNITFICRKLPGNLIFLIKYSVATLPNNSEFKSNNLYLNWLGATQECDSQQTINLMPKSTDLLIVDSYALDKRWHQRLRVHVGRIMVIDDLSDREFDCDILLNQNLNSAREDYIDKVPIDCKLLLGCNYALLRPEFNKLRKRAIEKRNGTKSIKKILISMGGSDNDNITYNVLQQLSDEFDIVVVLGETSPHNRMIANYLKDKNIELIINSSNMSRLMLEADLAIGASGSTSWERCCLGLPTLLYILAENQREIALNLERLGAVKIVNILDDDLQDMVDNFASWRSISDKARKICDGLGVSRVCREL